MVLHTCSYSFAFVKHLMLPAPLLSPPISLPLLCPAPLPYPMYTPMLCPPLPPLYTPSSLAVPPSPLPSLLPSLPLSILPVQIEEKLNFPFNPAFFFLFVYQLCAESQTLISARSFTGNWKIPALKLEKLWGTVSPSLTLR